MNADRIENAQLDLLDRPGKGQRRKAKALDAHEEHFQAAIRWLRGQLEPIARVRDVSANDARAIYDRSKFPKSYAQRRHFFGAIFRGPGWEKSGHTIALHEEANGREIKTWRYVG